MRLSRTKADSGAQGYTASVVTFGGSAVILVGDCEMSWLRPLEVVTLEVVVVLISGGRAVWF